MQMFAVPLHTQAYDSLDLDLLFCMSGEVQQKLQYLILYDNLKDKKNLTASATVLNTHFIIMNKKA